MAGTAKKKMMVLENTNDPRTHPDPNCGIHSPYLPLLENVTEKFLDFVTSSWTKDSENLSLENFIIQAVNNLKTPFQMKKILKHCNKFSKTPSYLNRRARQLADLQSVQLVHDRVLQILKRQGIKRKALEAYPVIIRKARKTASAEPNIPSVDDNCVFNSGCDDESDVSIGSLSTECDEELPAYQNFGEPKEGIVDLQMTPRDPETPVHPSVTSRDPEAPVHPSVTSRDPEAAVHPSVTSRDPEAPVHPSVTFRDPKSVVEQLLTDNNFHMDNLDFQSLLPYTTLTDGVIQTYLNFLGIKYNKADAAVLPIHFVHKPAGAFPWFVNTELLDMGNLNYSYLYTIIGDNSHWILVEILPWGQKIRAYDSFGSNTIAMEEGFVLLELALEDIFQKRFLPTMRLSPILKQNDGYNCGVACLQQLEFLLSDGKFPCRLDFSLYRKQIWSDLVTHLPQESSYFVKASKVSFSYCHNNVQHTSNVDNDEMNPIPYFSELQKAHTSISSPKEITNSISKPSLESTINDPGILNYTPDKDFKFDIASEDVIQIYNFKSNRFIPKIWGPVFKKCMKSAVESCDFGADRGVSYGGVSKIDGRWEIAKMNGSCLCGMSFLLVVMTVPLGGVSLTVFGTSNGDFKLVQDRPTNRRLTGLDRQKMAQRLENNTASKIYHQNLNQTSLIRLLHGNYMQRSLGSLSKLRSQLTSARRFSRILNQDILDLVDHYNEKPELYSKHLTGYIHDFKPNLFQLYLMSWKQISLAARLIANKKIKVRAFMDSTGGVVRVRRGLLTSLIFKVDQVPYFPVTEMISCKNDTLELSNFLNKLKFVMKKFKNLELTIDTICTDYSFANIHAILSSINGQTISEYLKITFENFQEIATFPANLTVLFICSAHIIKAFQRNLSKQIKDKKILKVALHAMGTLIEVGSKDDFDVAILGICRTFEKQFFNSEEERKTYLTHIQNTGEKLMHHSDTDVDALTLLPDPEIDLQNLENLKSQRERSPFYHYFGEKRIQFQCNQLHGVPNPNFSPDVVQTIEDYYIAYLPLFSRFAARTKPGLEDFLRESNAYVEAYFKDTKVIWHKGLPKHPGDFIRDQYEYTQAKITQAEVVALQKGMIKVVTQEPCPKPFDEPHSASESWAKRIVNLSRKVPRYLSSKTPEIITIRNDAPTDNQKISSLMDITETTEIVQDRHCQLRKSDFRTLFFGSRWINSEIIDGFCMYLKTKYNTCPKNICIMPWMVCVRPSNSELRAVREWQDHKRLFQKSLRKDTEIIYHVMGTGSHYVLLKSYVRTCVVELYDCLRSGTHRRTLGTGLRLWKTLLESHFNTAWTIEETMSAQQIDDGASCGPFCLRTLELLLGNEQLSSINNYNLYRWKIARCLLGQSTLGKIILSEYNYDRTKIIELIGKY